MKIILYLITSSSWGGAQKYVYDLAGHFQEENKFEVMVGFGTGTGMLAKRLKTANVPCHEIKDLNNSLNPVSNALAYLEIKNLINKTKPDLIHLNSTKAGFLGALAAKQFGIPVIFTAHGFISKQIEPPLKRYLHLLYDRVICKNSSKTICVSKSDFDQAHQLLPSSPLKFIHIPNGIRPFNLIGHCTGSKIVIGSLANLVPNKNISLILRSSMLLPECEFLIAGEGPERRRLEKMIAVNNISNVKLLGFQQDISRFLGEIDIFLLTSIKEGLPYALLEAASAGIPAIATRVGGNEELINYRRNGILIKTGSDTDLVRAIRKISKDIEGYKKRAKMLSAGLLQQYSIDVMYRKTVELYNSIID